MAVAPMSVDRKKSDRLEVRVSSQEKGLLTEAAALRHQDTGEFVRQTALSAAEAVLAESHRLRLSPSEWTAFQARLDEPPRYIPALRALFDEPSVFND